jgi:spore germination cell wall hydrolase CwlJ-like protein
MAAVADVVINRWKGNRWPPTVCSVVHQDSQFIGVNGWTAAGAERRNQEAWEQALAVSDLALAGAPMSPKECRGAMYFNQARKAKGYKHLCRVGVHHFYIEE